MNKPEKKSGLEHYYIRPSPADGIYANGYNQACDDWEKFLPDYDEILELLQNNNSIDIRNVAKAISDRLKGKQ